MDIYIDQTDRTKSMIRLSLFLGEPDADALEVDVQYWWSWRKQLSDDEFQDYLQLEALKELQLFDEAKALAEPKATGTLTQLDTGGFEDTRNWYQNWLDNFIPR